MTPLAVLLSTPLLPPTPPPPTLTTTTTPREEVPSKVHTKKQSRTHAELTKLVTDVQDTQLQPLDVSTSQIQPKPTTRSAVKHRTSSQEKEKNTLVEREGGAESAEHHTRTHSSSSNPTPRTPEPAGENGDNTTSDDDDIDDLSIGEDILQDDEELEYLKQRLRFELDSDESQQKENTSEEDAVSTLKSLDLTDPEKVFLRVFDVELKGHTENNEKDEYDIEERENEEEQQTQPTETAVQHSLSHSTLNIRLDTDLMTSSSLADALRGVPLNWITFSFSLSLSLSFEST
jgi:hypothetical protein